MNAWEVVDRTPDVNVLAVIWDFKINRLPDGLIKKFKACFCARGDDSWKALVSLEFDPMVQWTNVHLLLILEKYC